MWGGFPFLDSHALIVCFFSAVNVCVLQLLPRYAFTNIDSGSFNNFYVTPHVEAMIIILYFEAMIVILPLISSKTLVIELLEMHKRNQ